MAALEFIETETGPQPGATIIILHGLGADGNDFVPIARELDLAEAGPAAEDASAAEGKLPADVTDADLSDAVSKAAGEGSESGNGD